MKKFISEKLNRQQLFASFRSSKLMFILMGIASTLWFLIRVVPKPQRAGYPCMRAAAPIMSGFVLYLLSLGGMTLLFKKAVSRFKKARYLSGAFALSLSLMLLVVFNWQYAQSVYAKTVGFTRGVLPDGANNPMGEGVGIFPGRVTWAWNTDATDETCANTLTDAFYMPQNNNQSVINEMMDKSIINLGGQSNVKDSWDAIFKHFNQQKTGTASSYKNGETIFIKVNNGQAGWAINMKDLSETGITSPATKKRNSVMSGTTPATVLALIRQLVDECGVPENMILVGEPMTHVYKSMYDVINAEYPDVVILDKDGFTQLGRTKSKGWTGQVIKYSDQGTDMPDAISDNLMIEMYEADYMINAAALKAHARNGITLNAKLHFGSHGDHPGYGFGSFHLHDGLISTVDNDVLTTGVRGDYSMYRVLVDLMGHEKIGRNTILFMVDGLWGGVEATDVPVHWNMPPFNGDFPNSIFLSLDPVAIESVCLDFLRAEADQNTYFNDRPFFPGVDDYLHQAADKANWPAGFKYDPEGDGSEMPVLGVHEHWNNPTDMQYSRNLGLNKGIELYKVSGSTGNNNIISQNVSLKLYPNPSTEFSTLTYALDRSALVSVTLTSLDGKSYPIVSNKKQQAGQQQLNIPLNGLSKGLYLCNIRIDDGQNNTLQTLKLSVQ